MALFVTPVHGRVDSIVQRVSTRKPMAMLRLLTVLITALAHLIVFVELFDVVKPVQKLLIDHDGGADDAMALFMAFLYEKHFNGPNVIAVTTTHGNVDECQCFENTQRILGIAERSDVPIFRGCTSALIHSQPSDAFFGLDGLGDLDDVSYTTIEAKPQHAAVAMIELSKLYEDELIVLGIGALTNIALAVKLDPLFLRRILQLYIAAGDLFRVPGYPAVEFNAQADVEAYQVIVQNSTPDKVTIIPYSQVRTSFNIPKTWRKEVLGKIPTRVMQIQNSFERLSITKYPNRTEWGLLDPAAMAIVLKPSLVTEFKSSKNGMILCGENRGTTTNHFTDDETANVKLVYAAAEEPYKNLLLDIFRNEL